MVNSDLEHLVKDVFGIRKTTHQLVYGIDENKIPVQIKINNTRFTREELKFLKSRKSYVIFIHTSKNKISEFILWSRYLPNNTNPSFSDLEKVMW